ncbi:MAG: 4-(cytidine 5'-diphospho)-2-C-methyl-D-erythritol kinase [Pseudomonadota bacterium]
MSAASPGALTEVAPAKINLYLHVGGVRQDGLHALESLMVFTGDGDRVAVAPADDLSLTIIGPEAGALARDTLNDNLVLRAARALKTHARVESGAAITLNKRLPIAAGVGGGSADAAAALRALQKLWALKIDKTALRSIAFRLGADIPACLACEPVLVSGAGETLQKGPTLPPLWACLVNPRVATPTGPIFRAYDAENPTPPAPSAAPMGGVSIAALKSLFDASRNDLERAAIDREPIVADAIALLSGAPGAIGARMSGSGATAFALFSDAISANRTARRARAKGLWALASPIIARLPYDT